MSEDYTHQISGKVGDVIVVVRGLGLDQFNTAVQDAGLDPGQVQSLFQYAFASEAAHATAQLGLGSAPAAKAEDAPAQERTYASREDAAAAQQRVRAEQASDPDYGAARTAPTQSGPPRCEHGAMRRWDGVYKNGRRKGEMYTAYHCPFGDRDTPREEKCDSIWLDRQPK